MLEKTKKMVEEVIASYVDDSFVHGWDAQLTRRGTVEIRLWRNKECSPDFYEIPIRQFIGLSKAHQLPRWACREGGWYINDVNCSQYRGAYQQPSPWKGSRTFFRDSQTRITRGIFEVFLDNIQSFLEFYHETPLREWGCSEDEWPAFRRSLATGMLKTFREVYRNKAFGASHTIQNIRSYWYNFKGPKMEVEIAPYEMAISVLQSEGFLRQN